MTQELVKSSVTPPLEALHDGAEAVAFVNPRTGEAVDAKSDPDALADYLDLVRTLARELSLVDRQVSSWIVARMDASLSWTLETTAGKLEAASPASDPVYDLERLRGILHRLVRTGAISEEAARACIVQPPAPPAPPERVDRAAVNRLRKLPGVSKAIDRAVTRTAGDGERGVRLK